MRVKCLHGFFIFEELRIGQVSDFMEMSGLVLSPWRNYFTFEALAASENYSLQGSLYGQIVATKTFAGEPWEVFEANQIVYDFVTGLVVPIAAITQSVRLEVAGNRFISPGLILPGSITRTGSRIKNYSGFYSRDTKRWLYSEVDYV